MYVPPTAEADRPAVLCAPPAPSAVVRARHLAATACRVWGVPEHTDAAVLTASELVTNAVVHSATAFQLQMWRRGPQLYIAVHDRDPAFSPSWWDWAPEPAPDSDDAGPARGARYGLCLVRAMAVGCGGYEHPDGGKVMWAMLGDDAVAWAARESDGAVVEDPVGTANIVVDITDGSGRSESFDAARLVRRAILVNGVRRRGAPRRSGWRLELLLGWGPHAPEWVDMTLRASPRHPALPEGHWRVPRETLRAGLLAPASSPQVRLHPDPGGHQVLLDLTADPPQLVHVQAHNLLEFLEATDAAEVGTSTTA
jgi:hypothetical protein